MNGGMSPRRWPPWPTDSAASVSHACQPRRSSDACAGRMANDARARLAMPSRSGLSEANDAAAITKAE